MTRMSPGRWATPTMTVSKHPLEHFPYDVRKNVCWNRIVASQLLQHLKCFLKTKQFHIFFFFLCVSAFMKSHIVRVAHRSTVLRNSGYCCPPHLLHGFLLTAIKSNLDTSRNHTCAHLRPVSWPPGRIFTPKSLKRSAGRLARACKPLAGTCDATARILPAEQLCRCSESRRGTTDVCLCVLYRWQSPGGQPLNCGGP